LRTNNEAVFAFIVTSDGWMLFKVWMSNHPAGEHDEAQRNEASAAIFEMKMNRGRERGLDSRNRSGLQSIGSPLTASACPSRQWAPEPGGIKAGSTEVLVNLRVSP